jgi:hypothetical protein
MKIAAGIVGITIGITSIIYIGLIGGIVGSATSWLGSGPWAQGDTRVNDLGQLISLLSYLSGLLAIIGGIVAFSNPLLAGIILTGSAFSHWYLLGFGVVGKVFILPIAAAAFFAFISSDSKQKPLPSDTFIKKSDQTGSNESNATTGKFDHAKWDALLKYDKEISAIAEKLRPLGQKWLDEFASSYLALNDKTYLPEIEKKIFAAAKAEKEAIKTKEKQEEEKYERKRIYEKEQQKAFLQEQEHLAQERKKRLEIWRNRLWGNPRRKLLTITCVVILLLIAVAVTLVLRPKPYTDPVAYCKAVVNRDVVGEGGIIDSRYIGPAGTPNNPDNPVWRCMDGEVLDCNSGPSGRECTQYDMSTTPNEGIREFCLKSHEYNFVPNSMRGNSWFNWECNGTTPVISKNNLSLDTLDKRGYIKIYWHKISPPKTAETKSKESLAVSTAGGRGNDGRFIAYDNGTVLDTQTNLMWAAKDNGSDIDWVNAKSYCENYRGGGYKDWRMPTQDELAGLYDGSKSRRAACLDRSDNIRIHVTTELIDITCLHPWISETKGSDVAYFRFNSGERDWATQSVGILSRALPVRSGK